MKKPLMTACAACVALFASEWRAEATSFLQTDLVSDIPGLATIIDPTLQNPWGISHSGGSPFWISNQAANAATLYTVGPAPPGVSKVNINPPSGDVTMPMTASGPQGPTGTVFNSALPAFVVSNGSSSAPAVFMFANLNGTIDGWNPGVSPNAVIGVDNRGVASYTGLGLATSSFPILPGDPNSQALLYAANDAGTTGSINVFNSSFGAASLPAGAFATPAPIKALGLVPFNVQVLNGFVYVTYAPSGHSAQANATAGQGAVAVFNLDGSILPNTALVVGNQHLAAPWGLAIAPLTFGQFAGDLLVGNFSGINLGISVFDPLTGAFLGTIPINPGNGNSSFLWGLSVGNGGAGGFADTVYFTDGLNNEMDGLFGAISAVPEPATWAMLFLGFAGLGFAFRQSRRKVSLV
jgi:uncharacterized protein (TIGR03118 family)